jgi:hypothetical protein
MSDAEDDKLTTEQREEKERLEREKEAAEQAGKSSLLVSSVLN